jgi:hypothetical protein
MDLAGWFRVAAGALGALSVGAVCAQATGGITLVETSSVVTCLDTKLNDGKPLLYPPELVQSKQGALVRARMTFASGDEAPSIDIFYNTGDDQFAEIVRRHLRGYRLPCLDKQSAPVVMTQEFDFFPGDLRKVQYGNVWEEAHVRSVRLCVETGSGKPAIVDAAGTVIIEMTFSDPTKSPTTRVVYQGGEKRLGLAVQSVLDFVASYRMPCLTSSSRPLTTSQQFTFRDSSAPSYVLKDMTLWQLLGFTENLTQHKVRFDFNTMNCPFDVRLSPYQPHASNGVAQIERYDANRREFIEWMRKLVLKIPRHLMPHVIGRPIVVSVPCLVLDLS